MSKWQYYSIMAGKWIDVSAFEAAYLSGLDILFVHKVRLIDGE